MADPPTPKPQTSQQTNNQPNNLKILTCTQPECEQQLKISKAQDFIDADWHCETNQEWYCPPHWNHYRINQIEELQLRIIEENLFAVFEELLRETGEPCPHWTSLKTSFQKLEQTKQELLKKQIPTPTQSHYKQPTP